MRVVAYRHAAYDTPWWVIPSNTHGRFHRAASEVTQYLCLHPLGPAAEMLRHHVGQTGDPDTLLLNLWVCVAEIDTVVPVSFDNCAAHGITPEQLVGDDYGPTQDFADRLRAAGAVGVVVPSAALPGADNLILFGPKVLHPFLALPMTPEESPTGHLTDGARAPAEVLALVRWFGDEHAALKEWIVNGTYRRLTDPLAFRY